MWRKFLEALLGGVPFSKEADFVGVLPDDRADELKAKDWSSEEIASSAAIAPVFRKVNKRDWATYTIRDQDGSGSCVSQALAKAFEVLYKRETGKTVVFSATPIYQSRYNKPGAGMYIFDAFNIAVKQGTCPEESCPSQKMGDVTMDATKLPSNFADISRLVDALAYVSIPADFEYIAGWVEKYGVAHLHIAADRVSWSKDYPSLGSTNRGIRHAIAVVDAVTYKNVRYIVIEDSWGEFGEFNGQRLISEAVFYDMFSSAAGFTVLEYDKNTKAKFTAFTVWTEFGQRSDEVVKLQDYLKAKGYFPVSIESTGYYGNITALAVYNFQIANSVASPIVLNRYKGKYCHGATLDAINKNL